MPELSLFQILPAARADAWHQVRAPGGYEWWYFDAEDEASGLRIAAIFFDGFVFHPGYLRTYARFRRQPTRRPPPLPCAYRCAYLAVYERNRVMAQMLTAFAPADFSASSEGVAVRIGENRLRASEAGRLDLSLAGRPWYLTWRGPQRPAGGRLAADLAFQPLLQQPPHERPFLSRKIAGADHRWVIANPLCDVSGTIDLQGVGEPRQISFTGRGYHDHNYGTGPIGPGLRRWFWGRVLLEDRVLTFHFARPRDATLPDEVHVLEVDSLGVREIEGSRITVPFDRRTWLGLAYPSRVSIGDLLRLESPQVVDPSPFYLRLTYAAEYRGRKCTAFCEAAYPHRLRWPILGRMIEMSIERPAAAGRGAGA